MKLKFLSFIILISFFANSQKRTISVNGIVVNKKSVPIAYATVVLNDALSNKPISGSVSDDNGVFELKTQNSKFYISVSFIGFEKKIIKKFSIENGVVELGSIVLKENSESLKEVVVTAERSQTEFKLDKRVFNVGKDLSSTGASALEVLNNVPSVNVNIEGAISLRGSTGVQILINGKPSVIASDQGNALGTITADMIEKVEVITNPSAKYDAEGTTGIINIVLKKEERKGLNGSVTLNTGTPVNNSLGVSLNRRTEKFNLFSQIGMGYRRLPSYFNRINTNNVTNTRIENNGVQYRNEKFYNLVLGTDYHINDRNVVTLSGSYAYEIEDQPSRTFFAEYDVNDALVSEWERNEVTEATNPKFKYELQYKSDFKDHEDHMLLFSALGAYFAKDQNSDFNNTSNVSSLESLQKSFSDYKEAKYTFKLDYTKPFSEKVTMEAGVQYVLQEVTNDYSVSDFLNNDWVVDDNSTSVFDYNQNVFGVYGTLAYEGSKFGVKGGLRVENTDLGTELADENDKNERDFTNLFPSAHTSYKFTDIFSVQAGYSKRVYRPRLWDLMPFFNPRNPLSIRQGNPDLLPEFTDSFEVSSIFNFTKISMNLGLYYQKTSDVIERVSSFVDNVNTVRPENVGVKNNSGVELNAKYNLSKKVTFMGDFNFTYFSRVGEYQGISFDFSSERWSGKLTSKVKLPFGVDFEITGRYQSGYRTFQGSVNNQAFADMGLRKKILKGKGIFSLGVRDIFASRISVSEIKQPDFEVYNESYRGRFLTFGFSYGFGKGEAMEYAGKRR